MTGCAGSFASGRQKEGRRHQNRLLRQIMAAICLAIKLSTAAPKIFSLLKCRKTKRKASAVIKLKKKCTNLAEGSCVIRGWGAIHRPSETPCASDVLPQRT